MTLALHEAHDELYGAFSRRPDAWAAERARLVRLCARLTGDAVAADDLAQETLLEAWRSQQHLRDPERFSAWLSGIARNVCLRWMRRQQSPVVCTRSLDASPDEDVTLLDEWLTDPDEIELALERRELATLLDRALALLPAQTRDALLAHYLEEAPLAQIAERLGVQASAVAVRLQRGRLALRRLLTAELGGELAAYTTHAKSAIGWEETRLWCTVCGRRRLVGRYDLSGGELWLRCPDCSVAADDYYTHTHSLEILGGVRGYQRAYNRLTAWVAGYYPPNLRTKVVPCQRCGRPLPLRFERIDYLAFSSNGNNRGLRHWCPTCDHDCWESLDGLLLASREGVAFMRQHERIRTLPHYEIETEGRTAIVARYESITESTRMVVIAAGDSFELLRVERAGL
jgi:RNA polymerase sigma factor (sigma-70 family)